MAAIIDNPLVVHEKMIRVNDVFTTLNQLAELQRNKLTVPVIAITGSNGKTTTKELIRAVLSKKFIVHATEGNLNNHIGVPVTLLQCPDDAGIVLIEMGANHPGEIAALCHLAKPTHGLITNIGKAHLEGFGSFEGVIEAKSELYHYLRENCGIAIYNDSDKLLSELIFRIPHKAVPYSDPSGTDLVVSAADDTVCLKVTAEFHGIQYTFATNLFGSHNLDNVRAAMAVGTFFGIPIDDTINAISSYKPGNNRSQILKTDRNTVICDSYNANPSSMIKALTSFSGMKNGKKMIILGDMLELGNESIREHINLLNDIGKLDVGDVVLCGPLFKGANSDIKCQRFSDVSELRIWLSEEKPQGYSILVKGSRGMALDRVYDLL